MKSEKIDIGFFRKSPYPKDYSVYLLLAPFFMNLTHKETHFESVFI